MKELADSSMGKRAQDRKRIMASGWQRLNDWKTLHRRGRGNIVVALNRGKGTRPTSISWNWKGREPSEV